MPKPRHLALGVLPDMVDGDLTRFIEREVAAEMPEELRCAMGLEPGPGRIGISGEHQPHFLQHTRLQHRIEACRDPLAQPRAIRRELDRCEAPRRWRLLAVLPGAERTARSPPDLPGADMALAIAGLQPCHYLRVMLGQAGA